MTLPVPRDAVAALPAYVPGARGTGVGLVPIKLSSNENPCEPLPSVCEAIAKAAPTINRYPDMFAVEVTEALADRLGVPVEDVVVGAGSVAVLGHALQAFSGVGDEVIYAWRSFEAYPILTGISGATAVAIPLTTGGVHDCAAMAAAVTERTKAVVLCSPNNPTGPAINGSQFEEFMGAIPENVLVILDEAYIEFTKGCQVVNGLDAVRRYRNLIVARTFSKAYGLAGLRVGYAFGDPSIISAIRTSTTPFSVSALAQVAVLASLDAEQELLTRVDAIIAERERILSTLRERGWEVPETCANFFFLPVGDEASTLAEHLKDASPSILCRPFAGEGVRITIGLPEENDALLAALDTYLSRRK